MPHERSGRSTCTIEGCDRPVAGHGLCNLHYLRWKKHNDPLKTVVTRSRKRWLPEELAEIHELIEAGRTDAYIAERMGCSVVALNLARKRHGVPSRSALQLSSRDVARQLGVPCAKTVVRWIERGWLPARRSQERGEHRDWWITEDTLLAFLANPAYWVAWRPERITDRLMREWALELRAGVRYLTPSEVAERCYVCVGAVNDWLNLGLLPGVKYGNWWVLESDLEQFTPPGQREYHNGTSRRRYSLDEDQQILAMRDAGATFQQIGKALKRRTTSVAGRYERIKDRPRLGPWEELPLSVDAPASITGLRRRRAA